MGVAIHQIARQLNLDVTEFEKRLAAVVGEEAVAELELGL
jgi:hypothetical protein